MSSLNERVLKAAREAQQPFFVPDLRDALPGVNPTAIFHELRDLYEDGVIRWDPREGYSVVQVIE